MLEPDWKAIEKENHDLTIRSTRFLGEGWNARAFLVNDELVFRFPKHPDHWEELERETKFLAYAAGALPLAVPNYVNVTPNSPVAPQGYATYWYLPGQTMDVNNLDPEKLAVAADSIATFLRAMHGLHPKPEDGFILPPGNELATAQEYSVRAEDEIIPNLSPPEAAVVRKQFEMYLGTPENFSFHPVVLHADLSRNHVLMTDSAITGVIDFGDINWGDPDYDFMYLFVDFGQTFIEEVARRYGHADVEGLLAKLQYFGMVEQIGTILDGPGRALDGQVEAAWKCLKLLLKKGENGH